MICLVAVTAVFLRRAFRQSPRLCNMFFFLMIRRPPRSTLDRSSAASDVYKRQVLRLAHPTRAGMDQAVKMQSEGQGFFTGKLTSETVSYTHLRAHETVLDLVCRLLLEKKKKYKMNASIQSIA